MKQSLMSYIFNTKQKLSWWSIFTLTIFLSLAGKQANALPGQSADTVVAWINANPTLRPGIGDGLIVRKFNTPAQRFTFQASVLPPGHITVPVDQSTIRSERFSFYDTVNGVTLERLKESLRVIYGPGIYQDFDRAQIVYSYPLPQTIDLSRRQNLTLLAAQQGELRLGERYAYWIDITKTKSGKAYNGQLTIFLPEDLNKLATELRNR